MILASQSPRRIELMHEAGYEFRVIPADIDETPHAGEDPFALVQRLANEKAQCICNTDAAPGEIVLAADTIVCLDGYSLGKPADEDEALEMLQRLSGKTHQVATGVCIATGNDRLPTCSFIDISDVTFFPLTEQEMVDYVRSGEALDKAGAYGIQGAGGRLLVERIAGDFYNVVGLPIAKVYRKINHLMRRGGF